VPDDECFELISNGATLNQLRNMATTRGMVTLRGDGIEKVKQGVTTLEEVYRVTA
jgi:type IV pilus assembly protein PilB